MCVCVCVCVRERERERGRERRVMGDVWVCTFLCVRVFAFCSIDVKNAFSIKWQKCVSQFLVLVRTIYPTELSCQKTNVN